jgi:hypothetical protein
MVSKSRNGILLTSGGKNQAMLCANDKFKREKSDNVLQIAVNELNRIIKIYDMKMFPSNKSNWFIWGKRAKFKLKKQL